MTKIKKYLLFSGASYYPAGFNDYRGSFDTIEEAEARHAELRDPGYSWYEIVEHATMKMVKYGS